MLCFAAIVVGVAFTIYQVFSVPRVADKLVLTYKSDSKKMKDILKETNLESMTFTTCLAGSVQKLQMPLMLFFGEGLSHILHPGSVPS